MAAQDPRQTPPPPLSPSPHQQNIQADADDNAYWARRVEALLAGAEACTSEARLETFHALARLERAAESGKRAAAAASRARLAERVRLDVAQGELCAQVVLSATARVEAWAELSALLATRTTKGAEVTGSQLIAFSFGWPRLMAVRENVEQELLDGVFMLTDVKEIFRAKISVAFLGDHGSLLPPAARIIRDDNFNIAGAVDAAREKGALRRLKRQQRRLALLGQAAAATAAATTAAAAATATAAAAPPPAADASNGDDGRSSSSNSDDYEEIRSSSPSSASNKDGEGRHEQQQGAGETQEAPRTAAEVQLPPPPPPATARAAAAVRLDDAPQVTGPPPPPPPSVDAHNAIRASSAAASPLPPSRAPSLGMLPPLPPPLPLSPLDLPPLQLLLSGAHARNGVTSRSIDQAVDMEVNTDEW